MESNHWVSSTLAALLLAACTPSPEASFKAYQERVSHGDLTARLEVLQRLPEAKGKSAFWAALALDPGAHRETLGADATVAAALYREALRAGVDTAGFNLALLAISGKVPLEAKEGGEPESIADLLTRSAKGGCVPAMLLLGDFYRVGGPGFAKNDVLSADWYEQAARFNRNALAELRLGVAYLDGNGRPRDVRKGVELLTSSAEGGEAESAGELAARATSQQLKARWLAVAAELDRRYAAKARESLEGLDASQLADVRDSVEVWKRAFGTGGRRSVNPTAPWPSPG